MFKRFIRLLVLLLGIWLSSATALDGQSLFRFECYSGFLTGDSCDICGPVVQSRAFSGLLVWRDTVIIKHLDCPYTVREFDSVYTIRELIPNPDQFVFDMRSSEFATIAGLKDSILCGCAGLQTSGGWTVSDSVDYRHQRGDTLYVAGAGTVFVSFDSLTNVLTIGDTTGSAAQLLTAGGAGPTSYTVDLSGGGGSVTLAENGGIDLSRTTNTIFIAATDASVTNEAQTLSAGGTTSPTITLSTAGGAGGGTVTFTGTGGIALNQSGGTITIDASGVSNSITWTGSGDVTGTATGTTSITPTLTISANAVTNGKFRQSAGWSLVGRAGSTTGNVADITASVANTAMLFDGVGLYWGNIYATDHLHMYSLLGGRLLGRTTAGPGLSEEISLGSGLSFSGSSIVATDASATNEAQTWSNSGTTSYTGTLSAVSGSGGGAFSIVAGTGVTIAHSGGTVTITNSAPAASITANNGLTMSTSTNAQLGGTLIQNTTIDQDAFNLILKDGRKMFTRYNNTPSNNFATVEVEGIGATPAATGTSEDAVFAVKGYNNGGSVQYANALYMGLYTTAASGTWLQSRSQSAFGTNYPLSLNPRGGKLVYNSLTASDALVTLNAVGLGAIGDDAMAGNVVGVFNSEGNTAAKIGFGVGFNLYDAGIGYFDTDNSLRLYNRNTTTGTSIRLGFGSETGDEVVVTTVGTGLNVSTTSAVHSTLTVNGSIAGAFLSTLGAPTFDDTKFCVRYTGASPQTYTLPTASTCTGRVYWIANTTAQTITLSASVSSGSGTTFNTLTTGQHAIIISTGSGWLGFKLTSL